MATDGIAMRRFSRDLVDAYTRERIADLELLGPALPNALSPASNRVDELERLRAHFRLDEPRPNGKLRVRKPKPAAGRYEPR
jgi:hypothetical protein